MKKVLEKIEVEMMQVVVKKMVMFAKECEEKRKNQRLYLETL